MYAHKKLRRQYSVFNPPAIVSKLEECKFRLDRYWSEYNNIQTQIELHDEPEINDRIAFEEAFILWQLKYEN